MIFCHIKRKRFVASHAKTGFKLIDQQTENCPFNTVAVCRINGSSAQKAFDDISVMISARFAAWDQTVNMLPTWGKDVDAKSTNTSRAFKTLFRPISVGGTHLP